MAFWDLENIHIQGFAIGVFKAPMFNLQKNFNQFNRTSNIRR